MLQNNKEYKVIRISKKNYDIPQTFGQDKINTGGT
jgi:hypothetical protein